MALTKVTGQGLGTLKTLAGSTTFNIDTDGHITKPLQPAFLVKPDANQDSLAVNTYHTVQFDEEKFDLGSDFNTSTYEYKNGLRHGKYKQCKYK